MKNRILKDFATGVNASVTAVEQDLALAFELIDNGELLEATKKLIAIYHTLHSGYVTSCAIATDGDIEIIDGEIILIEFTQVFAELCSTLYSHIENNNIEELDEAYILNKYDYLIYLVKCILEE